MAVDIGKEASQKIAGLLRLFIYVIYDMYDMYGALTYTICMYDNMGVK